MNEKNFPRNYQGRRDFVKNSSLLAGGLMAAPLLSKANLFSGSDNVIKIALIGCGGREKGKPMRFAGGLLLKSTL